ncbi:MAG: hypothetical protein ABFD92_21530 [Planctomycetaceae bacterium]
MTNETCPRRYFPWLVADGTPDCAAGTFLKGGRAFENGIVTPRRLVGAGRVETGRGQACELGRQANEAELTRVRHSPCANKSRPLLSRKDQTMKVRFCETVDVSGEVDVDLDMVLQELFTRIDEGEDMPRQMIAALDWMTRILKRVSSMQIERMPKEVREEIRNRLTAQAARY